MIMELYDQIARINEENDLEISLDTIADIYGSHVVTQMAQMPCDVVNNIEYLISLGFEEDVTDICNRYGILLCQDCGYFSDQVQKLICRMGDDYVQKMGSDMSCWESLM